MKKSVENRSNKLLFISLLTCIFFMSGCGVSRNSNYSPMIKKESAMKYPAFFDQIEHITVKDDLGKFLGTSDDGIVEITYYDIVKMAGHSCATVGGAYLVALKSLKELYKDEIPIRGQIMVEVKKSPTENNAGVMGTVLSNITGATTDNGFSGIPGGKFNRRNLLFYNAPIETDFRLTRLDTKQQVNVNFRPGKIVNPKAILMSAIGPNATQEDKQTFPIRFQEMVKKLFDNADLVIDVVASH